MHNTKEKVLLWKENVINLLHTWLWRWTIDYLSVESVRGGVLLVGEETGLVSLGAPLRRPARTSAILQGHSPEELKEKSGVNLSIALMFKITECCLPGKKNRKILYSID